MPNWYGMHGSVMICVEVCAGGYCVLSCSKFILKVFVMTNNGKHQFTVRCILCLYTTMMYVCSGSIVCFCGCSKFIAQISRDLTNPGKP